MTMADAVAVLDAGRVEQQGPPAELYEHPRTTFVANFLGTSNLIEAEIVDADGPAGEELAARVPGAESTVRLPARRCAVEDVRAGARVLVGVRPEKIALRHADDPGNGADGGGSDGGSGSDASAVRNRLTGTVRDAGYLGVSLQYVVDGTGCGELAVYEQNIERDERLRPGADVVLVWQPAHTFALDAAQSATAGTEEETAKETAKEPEAEPEAAPEGETV